MAPNLKRICTKSTCNWYLIFSQLVPNLRVILTKASNKTSIYRNKCFPIILVNPVPNDIKTFQQLVPNLKTIGTKASDNWHQILRCYQMLPISSKIFKYFLPKSPSTFYQKPSSNCYQNLETPSLSRKENPEEKGYRCFPISAQSDAVTTERSHGNCLSL